MSPLQGNPSTGKFRRESSPKSAASAGETRHIVGSQKRDNQEQCVKIEVREASRSPNCSYLHLRGI